MNIKNKSKISSDESKTDSMRVRSLKCGEAPAPLSIAALEGFMESVAAFEAASTVKPAQLSTDQSEHPPANVVGLDSLKVKTAESRLGRPGLSLATTNERQPADVNTPAPRVVQPIQLSGRVRPRKE